MGGVGERERLEAVSSVTLSIAAIKTEQAAVPVSTAGTGAGRGLPEKPTPCSAR